MNTITEARKPFGDGDFAERCAVAREKLYNAMPIGGTTIADHIPPAAEHVGWITVARVVPNGMFAEIREATIFGKNPELDEYTTSRITGYEVAALAGLFAEHAEEGIG